jgi:hypothetical protein
MKKLILTIPAAFLFLSMLKAQSIQLEQNYFDHRNMTLHYIEGEGHKYVGFDTSTKTIMFYNLDHSVFKTIGTNLGNKIVDSFKIQYPSRTLFNLNNDMDVLFSYKEYNGFWWEPKMVVLSELTLSYGISNGISAEIRKTPYNGWKMIVERNISNGSSYVRGASVYSLPGNIRECNCFDVNTDIINHDDDPELPGMIPTNPIPSSIYPNPMNNSSTIRYTLPNGVNTAQLGIYNHMGLLMKTYTVSDQFEDIIIYKEDLPAGEYIYKINGVGAVKFRIE